MSILAVISGVAALIQSSAGLAAEPPKPIEIMVLGTYHFANPGQDLHNAKADDVTTPKRQAELQSVADALATYRPTKIMIEAQAKSPDLIYQAFNEFTPEALRTERSERTQIGYRLAHQMKLGKVYAIDEQPGSGEPDYFPFGTVMAFAQSNQMMAPVQDLMAQGAAIVKQTEDKQSRATIAELLTDHNLADGPTSSISAYYSLLGIGDTEQQPGADLNAMWYLRNAKIFAKLMTVAEPGDRILVIYGSGHSYWLRHFARETPGYRSVDPVPYLKQAAGAR